MDMSVLSPNLINLLNSEPVRTTINKLAEEDETGEAGSFANILKDAIDTTINTDRTDKGNNLLTLMGENDDLSGMMVDMQKAEVALQLTLQIRNKILDAYNEVMRMSV